MSQLLIPSLGGKIAPVGPTFPPAMLVGSRTRKVIENVTRIGRHSLLPPVLGCRSLGSYVPHRYNCAGVPSPFMGLPATYLAHPFDNSKLVGFEAR